MKKLFLWLIIVLMIVVFYLAGCKAEAVEEEVALDKSEAEETLPMLSTDLDISRKDYFYDAAADTEEAALKIYRIPSRCESLDSKGTIVRTADIIDINWSDKVLTYRIYYTKQNLESIAKFQLGTYRAIIEETFPDLWYVKYEYTNDRPIKFGIPAKFTIYSYSPETEMYDYIVDKYKVEDVSLGMLYCRNQDGNAIEVDGNYIWVVPDE